MILRFFVVAMAVVGLVAFASPSALADQVIPHEVDDGKDTSGTSTIGFSWLTAGSNYGGGSSTGLWRLSGVVKYTFNDAGDVISASEGTLKVYENIAGTYEHVGYVTFDDAEFSGQDGDDDRLGYFDVSFAALTSGFGVGSDFEANIAAAGDTARISFRDKSYYGSDIFNTYSTEEIALWGNEMITAQFEPLYTGTAQGYAGQANNWGFDYYSTQVPEPGSIALLGLGLVGLAFARHRRRAS